MNMIEYGKENSEVIILLHGGGLSWWNYREQANMLKGKYHVVIPVLDGHADSDIPFTTIENNAKELISYIDTNYHGEVLAIGGLSLGGQILVEMLSQRNNICKYAVIESALVIPMRLTNVLIGPMIKMSYGLIKKKWFANAQFKSLKMQSGLFDDYYKDTCKIAKKDMICFLKANSEYNIKSELVNATAKTIVLVGGKEQKKMRRSAEILHRTIQGSELKILNQYYHGEFSINHPKEYTELLNSLVTVKYSSVF